LSGHLRASRPSRGTCAGSNPCWRGIGHVDNAITRHSGIVGVFKHFESKIAHATRRTKGSQGDGEELLVVLLLDGRSKMRCSPTNPALSQEEMTGLADLGKKIR